MPTPAMNPLSNIFVLEGPDGVGKTTTVAALSAALTKLGRANTVIRTPGGTPLGEKLRDILLNQTDLAISEMALSIIFTAAHISVAEAAYEMGKTQIVIQDRGPMSNYAYRVAGGMKRDIVIGHNSSLPYTIDPAHALYLRAPFPVLKARLAGAARPGAKDRFESKGPGFQEAVAAGYEELYAAGLMTAVDATQATPAIVAELVTYVLGHSDAGKQQAVFP